MSEHWNVLLPERIDPSGPESIADFAECPGMDEYESPEAALADIGRYDAVIVRVANLDASVIERADRLRVVAKHGVGLDTFEAEPPGPDHPLYERDDVVLTPHVGGVTDEALERVSERAADNVRTVYEGGIPESTVNREAIEEGRA